MDYFEIAKSLEEKLAGILAERNLLHTFDHRHHPMTLTVTQNQTPDAQMEIFIGTDGPLSSQDSKLCFVFHLDALEIQTSNRLVIDDKMMGKIKGLAKKIEKAYKDAYFAYTINMRHGEPEPDEEAEDDAETFDGFFDDEAEE